MNDQILSILVCPICYRSLYLIKNRCWLFCKFDGLCFPVRNRVAILLKNKSRSYFIENR